MGWFDKVLDMTVALSFDRSGFVRHEKSFEETDFPGSLQGVNILVTGATRGLGCSAATSLARRGATVVFAGRNQTVGAEAIAPLIEEGLDVHLRPLDLTKPETFEAFAASLPFEHLDRLVHNAGVLPAKATLARGVETTVATNLLGPFALTLALEAHLSRAPAPRVIWVSSGGGLTQPLDLKALFRVDSPFNGTIAYARTKRAEISLAEAFATRWTWCNQSSMHPGWADTPGVESSLPGFHKLTRDRLRTPAQGADTIVWLAGKVDPPFPNGAFWFDRTAAAPHPLRWTQWRSATPDALWDTLMHQLDQWKETA